MPSNAELWDERYRQPGCWSGKEPSDFLRQVLPLLPPGDALDVACGEGRNAIYLAAHGWHVTAVDRSRPALEKAEALAREHGVTCGEIRSWERNAWLADVKGRDTKGAGSVWLIEADLETLTLPMARFDLLVCFYYLQRSLLPAMAQALRPHGMLVYETYTQEHRGPGGPHNPEFLLRTSELREAFRTLDILFYSELSAGKGTARILARQPTGIAG